MARRSQSSACFFIALRVGLQLLLVGDGGGHLLLGLGQIGLHVTMSWLSIFSGFSAREMRS